MGFVLFLLGFFYLLKEFKMVLVFLGVILIIGLSGVYYVINIFWIVFGISVFVLYLCSR